MSTSLEDTFSCPITLERITDAVIDPEGNSFERSAIEDWVRTHGTSPITRTALRLEDLRPNRALNAILASLPASDVATITVTPSTAVSPPPPPPSASAPASTSTSTSTSTSAPATPSTSTGAGAGAGAAAGAGAGAAVTSSVDVTKPVTNPAMLTVSGARSPSTTALMLSIPDLADVTSRPPLSLVVAIDISSSMNTEATLQSESGSAERESTGLSILDIVRHAALTILAMLRDGDSFGIVTFSHTAMVRMRLTKINAASRKKAKTILTDLVAHGRTNIWDALKLSLKQLEYSPSTATPAVFLLTDGRPNERPPRGEADMLKRAIASSAGNSSAISAVHTFGFGYDTDVPLLQELATIGSGSFNFIPDTSFVGTVFIHALANLATIGAHHLTVSVTDSPSVSVPLEAVRRGQTRHVTLPYGCNTVSVQFYVGSQGPYTTTVAVDTASRDVSAPAERARRAFITHLSEALATAEQLDLSGAWSRSHRGLNTAVKTLVNATKAASSSAPSGDAGALQRGLHKDASGEISLALSTRATFMRWGQAYLHSILSAHRDERTNNFKDASVQPYGNGVLFNALRDAGDEIFLSLPPPKSTRPVPIPRYSYSRSSTSSSSSKRPTATSATSRAATSGAGAGGFLSRARHSVASVFSAPVSMRRFHSAGNGCVRGDCLVNMADGSVKPALEVVAGDHVVALSHDGQPVTAPVAFSLTTRAAHDSMFHVTSSASTLSTPGATGARAGAILTGYHPFVNASGAWEFPCDSSTGKQLPYADVDIVSFVLGDRSTDDSVRRPVAVSVGGVFIIALGHGHKASEAGALPGSATHLEHSLWSTSAITKLLDAHANAQGVAFAVPDSIRRDPITDLAVGLEFVDEEE